MRFHKQRALLVFVLACVGCAGAPPKKTGLMEDLEIDATRRELQILMYAWGDYASGQIELAADRIFEESSDLEVRQNAILWKLNAIPQLLKSGFANDPSAGLIGSWLFAIQMNNYFETGNGKDVFGPQQPIAVETSRFLLDRIVELVHTGVDSNAVDIGSDKLNRWAEEYPIRNQLFVREQFAPHIAKELAGDVVGGLSAAGAMHQSMLALTDRANIMTEQMPRMVQWQSQLLMAQGESIVEAHLDSAYSNLQPFLDYMSSERRAFTEDISHERTAILNGIAGERLAVLQALADERSEVLRTIAVERNITLEEINKLTLEAVHEIVGKSDAIAQSSIDRVFRRTLQLMALPFIVSVLLMIVALMLLRSAIQRMPRQTPPGDKR
jgi:hypothetical protein